MLKKIYRDKFNCKLIKKGYGYYTFEGVIEAIGLSINLGEVSEVEFIFNYKDEFMDDTRECCFDISSIAYIGKEAYHPQKGFFDSDREDGIYTYYPTREALYKGDLFEVMIQKCNEKLSSKNSLYLFDYNGVTVAYIEASKEDDKNNLRVIKELPIRKTVEKKSYKELKKLFEEEKIYRVIKLDLFDSEKEPIVRYYFTKGILC